MRLFEIDRNNLHVTCSMGFTLIELLIVVIIIGTVAAIAIPSYCDYTARSQVVDGLNVASKAQQPIERFWRERGRFPDRLSDLGSSEPRLLAPGYIEIVEWIDGGILIRMSKVAHRDVRGRALHIRIAKNEQGELTWVCGYAPIPDGYRVSYPNRTDISNRNLSASCKPEIPSKTAQKVAHSDVR